MDNSKVDKKETKKPVKSQMTEVLDYMQKHEYITQAIAIDRFGAYRLSDIVYRLRDRGYEISTRMVSKKNRYGHVTNYAEYKLKA